jgi:hypothetical protein
LKLVLVLLLLAPVLLTGVASAQPELVRKRLYPQFPCLPGEWPCTVAPLPKSPIQPLPDVRRVPQPPPFPDLGRRQPSPAYTPSPFVPYSTLPLQPGVRAR